MGDPPRTTFFEELKRRHLFRVAAAYALVAWILIQVAGAVFPALNMPAWSLRLVILLALFGFPIALVLAWAFEMTPEGPRRTLPEPANGSLAAEPGGSAASAAGAASPQRAAVFTVGIVVLLVALGSVYVLRRPPEGTPAASPSTATAGLSSLTQITFSIGVEEYPAFAPDGNRLAFSRDVGGYKQIYVRSLATGQEVQLTDEAVDHIQPVWSPDGRTLLYQQAREPGTRLEPSDVFGPFVGGDIWRIELATGRRRRILEDAYNSAYSSDGSHMAFDASWSGARRIWVADSLGRNPRQVTTDESEAVTHLAPAWSPDARKIAFQNIEKTKLDIRIVDVASGATTWLTNDLFPDVTPVWSRDGRDVLFSSPRGGGMNLWRIGVTESGTPAGPPRQITTGAGQDLHGAVSPDGQRLAFAILSQNADLWQLPVDPETGETTGPPEPLIATTREESRGAWSPDGRRIAFNSDRHGEMNLWLYSIDDGTTQQLTTGSGGDYQPRWSPDGRTLAFFSSRSGNADVWTIEVETGRLRQLTTGASLDVNPFFSPDGSRIAFHSDRGGRKEAWVVNSDGSDPRQLTTEGVLDHFLLWASDSRSLLVNTPRGLVSRVFLDGSPPRDLPGIRGRAHMSSSPDGSLIMDVEGHRTLWASPLAGGEPRRIFEFEDPEVRIDYPVWSPDGRRVIFDRHKPTAGDIWVLDLEGLGSSSASAHRGGD